MNYGLAAFSYNSFSVAANAAALGYFGGGYGYAGAAAFAGAGYGYAGAAAFAGAGYGYGYTGFNPGVPFVGAVAQTSASGLGLAASAGLIAPSVASAIGLVRPAF